VLCFPIVWLLAVVLSSVLLWLFVVFVSVFVGDRCTVLFAVGE